MGHTDRMKLSVAFLLLAACASPVSAPADPVVLPADDWQGCARQFDPAPDIAALTHDAAEQWSDATGCDVHLEEGGIPVRFVDRILNDRGEPQCGATHRLRDEAGAVIGVSDIEISQNRGDRCHLTARDVLHEMGHALAPQRGHTTVGLMAAAPNGTDYIDGVSELFVCEELLH